LQSKFALRALRVRGTVQDTALIFRAALLRTKIVRLAIRAERQSQFLRHVHAANRILHQPLSGHRWFAPSSVGGITGWFWSGRSAYSATQKLYGPRQDQNPKQKPENPAQKTHDS
jgi:hypothetical protein